MKRCLMSVACRILLAVAVFVVVGCGGNKPSKPEAVTYYPPAPDPPRLQFLTSFSNAGDLIGDGKEGQSSFLEFIVGTEDDQTAAAEIRKPYGLAMRDGKIYICDIGAGAVHVIDLKGKTHSRLGKRGQLKNPVNITFAPDGTAYVCDTQRHQVAVFNARDQFVKYLGDPKQCMPIDLAILGDELIVADVAGGEVEVWSKEGKFLELLAKKGKLPGQLLMPTNLAIGLDGHIFVTDTGSSIVNVYNRKGSYLRSIGAPGDRPGFFARPKGLAMDAKGVIYVADSHWQNVQLFAPTGGLLLYFGGVSAKPWGLGLPAGLAIDTTCLPMLRSYVDKDFEPEYLLFLANQYGKNKICIYAFGKSRTAKYTEVKHTLKATIPPPPKPAKKFEAPKKPAEAPATP